MNYIKHLTAFFNKLSNDYNLNPTHVSLYIALFQFWNLNRFKNPISISRDEVMRISKIYSKATYHKCMKELHEKGYVTYSPSYNPFRGSMVTMPNLSDELKPRQKKDLYDLKRKLKNEHPSEQVIEQALNKQRTGSGTSTGTGSGTGSGTGTEQALVPSINYINNTNISNILNGQNQKNNFSNKKNELISDENKKKLREKKDCTVLRRSDTNHDKKIPPEWSLVLSFFEEKKASHLEAEKFFNHFQSNGWLVGGKSKMKDWKAAARNWMLNAVKFQAVSTQPQPNHLHTSNTKNYGEPL